jgi:putative DNA primase/helicase
MSDPILAGPLNDTGMAERFQALHGDDFRFVPDIGWLRWVRTHWQADRAKTVVEAIYHTVARLGQAAAAIDDPKTADAYAAAVARYGNTSALYAVARRLESMRGIVLPSAEALNADPCLLTHTTGTVDLSTGTTRAHARADMITRCAPAADDPFGGPGTRWSAFLTEVFPDAELRAWVQRAVGCSVIGRQDDHVLFVAHGGGANGKGAFFGALDAALGPYFAAIPAGFLVESPTQAHPTEIADLMGRRLVVGAEVPSDKRLDEAKVKELTGGASKVKARFMNKDFIEFPATWTLWICCNRKPRVTGTDNGFWRRCRVVPFTRTFLPAEIDRHLPAKLAAERDQILGWIIEGARDYSQNGLGMCQAVAEASADYRDEEDVFGQALRAAGDFDANSEEPAAAIQRAICRWYEDQGVDHPPTAIRIARELRARGLTERRTSVARMWSGFRLHTSANINDRSMYVH